MINSFLLNNLIEMLSSQDKYDKIEEIYRQALTLTKTILDKKYSDTLTSTNNLILVLSRQGRA